MATAAAAAAADNNGSSVFFWLALPKYVQVLLRTYLIPTSCCSCGAGGIDRLTDCKFATSHCFTTPMSLPTSCFVYTEDYQYGCRLLILPTALRTEVGPLLRTRAETDRQEGRPEKWAVRALGRGLMEGAWSRKTIETGPRDRD